MFGIILTICHLTTGQCHDAALAMKTFFPDEVSCQQYVESRGWVLTDKYATTGRCTRAGDA